MSEKKSVRKISGIIVTVLVVCLMLAVALYAFLGRSDNTRTHFKAASTDTVYTDMFSAPQMDEFQYFLIEIEESESTNFNDTFKSRFPKITDALTDTDFIASETDIKSYDFGGALMILDGYSYTSVMQNRWLDVLYIPYEVDNDRNFVIHAPKRYTCEYKVSLGIVNLCEIDKENYRLNPYTIGLNVKIGDYSKAWNAALEQNFSSSEAAEKSLKNAAVTDSEGKNIKVSAQASAKKAVSAFSVKNEQAREFNVTLSFDDVMFEGFESAKLSLVRDDGYKCDGAAVVLTVNG